jgi:hypothetical protein
VVGIPSSFIITTGLIFMPAVVLFCWMVNEQSLSLAGWWWWTLAGMILAPFHLATLGFFDPEQREKLLCPYCYNPYIEECRIHFR